MAGFLDVRYSLPAVLTQSSSSQWKHSGQVSSDVPGVTHGEDRTLSSNLSVLNLGKETIG